jgi:diguanylate cyclase (GGDEF)-like protein
LRDARVIAAVRLLGLFSFVLVMWRPMPHDPHFTTLLAGLVIGAVLQVVSIWGPGPRARSLAFESGLVMDIVVLTLVLHLTGGIQSPLLLLVGVWTVIGVTSHGERGAIAFSALLVQAILFQWVLAEGSGHEPAHVGPYLLLAATLVTASASAAMAWWMARVLADSRRRLEEMALRDPLTGLWNRRSFELRLEQMAALSERTAVPFALAMLDLDRFKQINDQFGHHAGDMVLRHVADVLRTNARGGDEVFRMGGDELAVLFPATVSADACLALERVRTALRENPPEVATVTFSAGVAQNLETEDMTRLADRRLYEAKALGRDAIRGCPRSVEASRRSSP